MLEAILRSNPRSDFMYVVDTRPKVSPVCLRNGLQKYKPFSSVCSGGLYFACCVLPAGCAHSKNLENILALYKLNQ